MEHISKQMFMERGLNAFDAFVRSAQMKHAAPPKIVSSEKQLVSKINHAWTDRVFKECAILEINGTGLDDEQLSKLTSHHETLAKIKKDDDRIKDLEQTVRAERTSGFLTCKSCRSTKVDVDQVQTRSADEPMTLFALCQDCGSRWTMK
jgi:DNA-directed RNA polymerase subunit M/transcription elongation factor TFIIS